MQKEVRVLELLCDPPNSLKAIADRHKGKQIHYVGINKKNVYTALGKEWGETIEKLRLPLEEKQDLLVRTTGEIHFELLSPEKPEEFKKQLTRHLQGQKFDEIHYHMPNSVSGHQHPVEALSVIKKFLKKNGRFYHVFGGVSPFVHNSYSPPKFDETKHSVKEYFEAAEDEIKPIAEQSGFQLEALGVKANGWRTRKNESEKDNRKNKAITKLIKGYTSYQNIADHFFILKKR